LPCGAGLHGSAVLETTPRGAPRRLRTFAVRPGRVGPTPPAPVSDALLPRSRPVFVPGRALGAITDESRIPFPERFPAPETPIAGRLAPPESVNAEPARSRNRVTLFTGKRLPASKFPCLIEIDTDQYCSCPAMAGRAAAWQGRARAGNGRQRPGSVTQVTAGTREDRELDGQVGILAGSAVIMKTLRVVKGL
jgi:hypothetical protein